MREERTIQKEAFLSGVGIHTGKVVDVLLKPSLSGGIVFKRTDLDDLGLKLNPQKIETAHSSLLVHNGYKIYTIEHLLAALYIFGIDNLIIELNGEEIPILDGSAAPFVEAILKAGIKLLSSKKKSIKIIKPFIISEDESYIAFYPDSEFKISYSIEFDHPVIQTQDLSLSINVRNFVTEIAPARTFGFLKDVAKLRSNGLGLGGSLENTIVLGEDSIINGSLRYPDEFVRHKILDLVGDLSLLGYPLIGHFKAHKAGHLLHLKAVQFLLNSPEFWEYEEKDISFRLSLLAVNNKKIS
ncbi:MAG: UDP-3-O-acyl-N-acetylglucosamine deacetylase [Candidatus Aminicenantia bacterium]